MAPIGAPAITTAAVVHVSGDHRPRYLKARAITTPLVPISGIARHLRVPAVTTALVPVSGLARRLRAPAVTTALVPISGQAAPPVGKLAKVTSAGETSLETSVSSVEDYSSAETKLETEGTIEVTQLNSGTKGNGGDPPMPPNVVAAQGDGGVPKPLLDHQNLQLLIRVVIVIAGLAIIYTK